MTTRQKLKLKIDASENEDLLVELYRILSIGEELSPAGLFSDLEIRTLNEAYQEYLGGDICSDDAAKSLFKEWKKEKLHGPKKR